ncbi:MAG: hypothetical protein JO322_00340 [Candidatus Eremiobacteraeota bacterium]|nr:hypothetical protein [Candidatus Eremiobacteraeota bacterium]
MNRSLAALPAVLVFAACSSSSMPGSPATGTSSSAASVKMPAHATAHAITHAQSRRHHPSPTPSPTPTPAGIPTASPTPLPAITNLRGITYDDISGTCSASSQELATEQALNNPTVRVVFDNVPASCYTSAIQSFDQYGRTMGELIDSSDMTSYSLSQVQSRVSDYVSTLGNSVNIWEIGNEVNGEWLSNVNCSGGNECSAQANDVMSKIEAMYNGVTAAGGTPEITLYYEPPQTVTPGYDMINWEETYIPASMHQGLKYVLVSYYETDNNGIRPTQAQWDTIFKQLATDFPNAKVGFGEIGMDNPITSSTLSKATSIFNYYQELQFPDIPQYTRAGFWWYGAEDLAPSTKWPAFFNDVQSNL